MFEAYRNLPKIAVIFRQMEGVTFFNLAPFKITLDGNKFLLQEME